MNIVNDCIIVQYAQKFFRACIGGLVIMGEDGFKYYAFISYSHMDKEVAKKLQKRLEHYHLPSKLLKTNPALPKKLSPIFIDESDLVARGSLKETLQQNLETSNYLILVCSPYSADSKYVNDEVEYFIKIGRKDHIIPLIVSGVPHAEDEAMECFPPALLELTREEELLGIDLTKFGERDAFLRVIATMLELNLEDFVSREAKEGKRRAIILTSIVAAVMSIARLVVWYNLDTFNVMMYNAEAQNSIGETYYDNHDYARAMEWYQKAAAQGHALAQNNIGFLYQNGLGVEQDYAKAMEWYQKAAVNGNDVAQNNLGYFYLNGLGTERNYTKAIEWFSKAAAQNNDSAQNSLGNMYYGGLGVTQDYAEAREWYQKAALNGHNNAQKALGDMYFSGLGVGQDYVKAVEWYQRAANNGNVEAKNRLGMMYINGLGVKQDLEMAVMWYEKAADEGDSKAQYDIGMMYSKGFFLPKDEEKAAELFRKAAEQGHEGAKQQLVSPIEGSQDTPQPPDIPDASANMLFTFGFMYYKGEGVPRDYAKAMEWYLKAAKRGYPKAQNNIGVLYHDGKGVKQDYKKAMDWYNKAASQYNGAAFGNIGWMYQHGEGVSVDYKKAFEYFMKGAEQGNSRSLNQVGYFYDNGLGMKVNYEEAIKVKEEKNYDIEILKFNIIILCKRFKSIHIRFR